MPPSGISGISNFKGGSQGGASARTAAYWVVREGEWRHEEVAPIHERRRDGEAAG
jgi:hypothetical protein